MIFPSTTEVRDNATFDVVIHAFSRPGSIRTLPEPGANPIALSLIDRECLVFTDSAELKNVLMSTEAKFADSGKADHLFMAVKNDEQMSLLAGVNTGSPLYPDQGATIVIPVKLGEGQPVRLSGPGIESEHVIRVSGIHPDFWSLRARLCSYPAGIEIIFTDGADIVAIPRSTQAEEI